MAHSLELEELVEALHSALHRDPMRGETGAGGPSGLPSCG